MLMELHELKAMIKESLREVLREERFLLCKVLIPYISDEEQQDLEAAFGLPSGYTDEEVIDMTDWVQHGNQIPQERN
jgi:hypothetical protein